MSYSFFSNTSCEFFPCHAGLKEFNCLFCYCPLYHKADCGGNCSYMPNGIKDCSACVFPHQPENYEKIIKEVMK